VDDLTSRPFSAHSNVGVIQRCYIKTANSETKAAMQKMENALTGTNVTPKQPIPIKRAVQ
jgi:hypothetical protein